MYIRFVKSGSCPQLLYKEEYEEHYRENYIGYKKTYLLYHFIKTND